MKYVNSLKFMNSFESVGDMSEISQKRALELCQLLGNVHVGTRAIYLPRGAAGHATAVMLESVIKHSGYRVGRVTSAFGFDSRNTVFIDGEPATIEDYNLAVTEIKSAVSRASEEKYYKQEISFAISLLLCKMNACDYVILEGLATKDFDLASLCSPYELVIAPTVYGDNVESIRPICDAIARGVREVIIGNQKKTMYEPISTACVTNRVRSTLTSKTSFKTESLSSIAREFSYSDREGYIVKSPSKLVGDCAMLVIESALAIRRSGVKMPWANIFSGIEYASNTGMFDTFSVSPVAIIDGAETAEEAELLLATLKEIFGEDKPCGMSLCIPMSALKLVDRFEGIDSLIIFGEKTDSIKLDLIKESLFINDIKTVAKHIISLMREGKDILCFGSVAFASELRAELSKA